MWDLRFVLPVLLALATVGCSRFEDIAQDASDTSTVDTGDAVICNGVMCETDDPCRESVCDEATGTCKEKPLADGTSCNDGLYCVINTVCLAGECKGELRPCESKPEQCQLGKCIEETRKCVLLDSPDGDVCDDANACTEGETCTNGVCAGGKELECTDDVNPCTFSACDPATGACESSALGNGAKCDDQSMCTSNDSCQDGVCTGDMKDCSEFDDGCVIGVCAAENGECSPEQAPAGMPCDDGLLCTVDDQCGDTGCQGTAKDCSDLSKPCTEGVCVQMTGECTLKPLLNGTACDDGSACTKGDVCISGDCFAGTGTDCSALSDQCHIGTCNPESGECSPVAKQDGTDCSDGELCTTSDACTGGTCTGTPVDCTTNAPQCHSGSCNSQTGTCDFSPDATQDGQSCDDGLFCTVNDTCQAGSCVTQPKDCSGAKVSCHLPFCDEEKDDCTFNPAPEGTPCDDGKYCSDNDVCDGNGGCAGKTIKDCSAFDTECIMGVCKESAQGCVGEDKKDGVQCNDGDLCTVGDKCSWGACVAQATDCSDLDAQCVVGSCDAKTGQCTTVDVVAGTVCDDGLACTVGDTCQAGGCTAGEKVNCPCFGPSRALQLDGGCLALPPGAYINNAPGFTIEFWLKVPKGHPDAIVLDKRATAEEGDNDWYIELVQGSLSFNYGSSNGGIDLSTVMSGAPGIDTDEWVHVAYTRNKSAVQRWFLNGALLSAVKASQSKPFANSSSTLSVGCDGLNASATPFTGKIDELRISNFARYDFNTNFKKQLYTAPKRHLSDSLTVGLWHFDDGPDSKVAIDSGPKKRHGALNGNAAMVAGDVPFDASACCGDDELQLGEECDDGNVSAGDGCSPFCVVEGQLLKRSLKAKKTQSCVTVEGSQLLSGGVSALTLEFWTKVEKGESGTVALRAYNGVGQPGWRIEINSAGQPALLWDLPIFGKPPIAVSTKSIDDGSWHHIAMTLTSQKAIRWQVDGQLAQDGDTKLPDGVSLPFGTNSSDMEIGCGINALIDEFRINLEPVYPKKNLDLTELSKVLVPNDTTQLLIKFDYPVVDDLLWDMSSHLHKVSTKVSGKIKLSKSTPGNP